MSFTVFPPQLSLDKLKNILYHNLSQIGLSKRKNHVLLHLWTRLFTCVYFFNQCEINNYAIGLTNLKEAWNIFFCFFSIMSKSSLINFLLLLICTTSGMLLVFDFVTNNGYVFYQTNPCGMLLPYEWIWYLHCWVFGRLTCLFFFCQS